MDLEGIFPYFEGALQEQNFDGKPFLIGNWPGDGIFRRIFEGMLKNVDEPTSQAILGHIFEFLLQFRMDF